MTWCRRRNRHGWLVGWLIRVVHMMESPTRLEPTLADWSRYLNSYAMSSLSFKSCEPQRMWAWLNCVRWRQSPQAPYLNLLHPELLQLHVFHEV